MIPRYRWSTVARRFAGMAGCGMFRVTRRACGSDRQPEPVRRHNEISNSEEKQMSKSRLLTLLTAAMVLLIG